MSNEPIEVDVDDATYAMVQRLAEEEGISVDDMATRLVRNYLEDIGVL